jgi:hypothetical protein
MAEYIENMEVQQIIDDLYSKYLSNLLLYIKNNNIIQNNNYDWLEKQLKNAAKETSIKDTTTVTEIKYTDNQTEVEEKNSLSIETSDSKMVLSTENLYNKPWTKLNLIHKKIKIKEYINNLNNINTDDKSLLIDSLIKLLESKVLTKKNMVEYNQTEGKIISIYMLKYENNKYIINN